MSTDVPVCPQKSARRLAIELLATGKPIAKVARAVSRSRRTVSRWLTDPAFIESVRVRTLDNVQSVRAEFHALAALVPATVERVLSDADHPAASLSAARYIARVTGLDTPVRLPSDPLEKESVDLGGSLKVMTPKEAALLQEGSRIVVVVTDQKPSSDACDLAGPDPHPKTHRPSA